MLVQKLGFKETVRGTLGKIGRNVSIKTTNQSARNRRRKGIESSDLCLSKPEEEKEREREKNKKNFSGKFEWFG